jgi:hypothetical protein
VEGSPAARWPSHSGTSLTVTPRRARQRQGHALEGNSPRGDSTSSPGSQGKPWATVTSPRVVVGTSVMSSARAPTTAAADALAAAGIPRKSSGKRRVQGLVSQGRSLATASVAARGTGPSAQCITHRSKGSSAKS